MPKRSSSTLSCMCTPVKLDLSTWNSIMGSFVIVPLGVPDSWWLSAYMCARAYHWGGCRYHERQGFALGSSSSSSACSFMAAGLWCLCSYPLLAILISGLPWMTPPFEHPCAQVGRPHVPSGSWAGLLLPIVVPQRPSVGYLLPLFVSACARPHPSAPAWDGLSGNIAGLLR